MKYYSNRARLGLTMLFGVAGVIASPLAAAYPVTIQAAEAYVDSDPGTALTLSDGNAEKILQIGTGTVSKPSDGESDVLNIRFQDDDGVWSEPVRIGFPVYANTLSVNNVKAMEAFLDTDPGEGAGEQFAGIGDDSLVEKPPVVTLDGSALDAGGHFVAVRAQDSGDAWSVPVTVGVPIYQPPAEPPNQIAAMEGFIGYPPPSAGSGTAFAGVFDSVVREDTGNVSIINLPQGVFPYGARVKDTGGEWSDVVTMTFEFIDTDGDGIPDSYEDAHGMDKNDPSDAYGDNDDDKFSNYVEYVFESDPNNFFANPTGTPECSSGPADVLLDSDFYPGKYLCIGITSITAETLKVHSGAHLFLRSPNVELSNGLGVEEGATARARTTDLVP